jgi:hypothetical protein
MIKKGLLIVLWLGVGYFILFEWLGIEIGRSLTNEVDKTMRGCLTDTSKVHKDTCIHTKVQPVQRKPSHYIKGSDGLEYKVIVIDGCEYIKRKNYSKDYMVHKGNCSNHQNNNKSN